GLRRHRCLVRHTDPSCFLSLVAKVPCNRITNVPGVAIWPYPTFAHSSQRGGDVASSVNALRCERGNTSARVTSSHSAVIASSRIVRDCTCGSRGRRGHLGRLRCPRRTGVLGC